MAGIHFERQRALILAPHADDETLGCGGVIQKYKDHQSQVRVLIASFVTGQSKRYKKDSEAYRSYQGSVRLRELKQAMNILGVTDYHILFKEGASDNRYHSKLDGIPRLNLVEPIEKHITDFKPTVMYIPSITKHQDHEALHQAALAAIRPYFWNGSALVYETDGELSFQPNLYVPLSQDEMKRKVDALQAYLTQLQDAPHPVSSEAVYNKAKFRGNQIYSEYAEAFQVLRMNVDAGRSPAT